MKKYGIAFCCFISAVVLTRPVYAEYVLPYPSYMPGNKLYTISKMVDKIKKYWYWGTIAETKYQLSLSDKYLVEAKTLFEYKQYLLATNALKQSDSALEHITTTLEKGNREGKDMSQLEHTVYEAMKLHIEKLEIMKEQLPSEFLWTPEKKEATQLLIDKMIDASIVLRQKIQTEIQGRMERYTKN